MQHENNITIITPDTASGVLALMPASQAQVDRFSDQLIESVRNGELDPLQLLATFKATEMVIERTRKETKENQMNAADKYPGEKFEAFGCTMQKADVYTSYDYESTTDPVWRQLKQIAESAAQQLKDREAFLKTIKSPMTIVEEGTGEVVTLTPPVKKSTPGLKISIK